MALRLATRRWGTAYNGVVRTIVQTPVLSRRNASAMPVPTQSLVEDTKHDYAVSVTFQDA